MNNSVCAVLVTFNRKSFLREVCASILAQSRLPDQVLVVDNGSTDSTTQFIAENFPALQILRLPNNMGCGYGFQAGIKRALENGFGYIWLLEDDIRLKPDTLAKLVDVEKQHYNQPHQSVFIPLHVDTNDHIVEVASREYDLSNPFKSLNRIARPLYLEFSEPTELDTPCEMAVCSFEGPLIPRQVIEKVGLPNASYFLYGDDTDYAFRIRRAGFKILLVPTSHIIPLVNRTTSNILSPWKEKLVVRNRIWLTRLYCTNTITRIVRIVNLSLLYLLALSRKNRWKDRARTKAYFDGVYEGLFTTPEKTGSREYQ